MMLTFGGTTRPKALNTLTFGDATQRKTLNWGPVEFIHKEANVPAQTINDALHFVTKEAGMGNAFFNNPILAERLEGSQVAIADYPDNHSSGISGISIKFVQAPGRKEIPGLPNGWQLNTFQHGLPGARKAIGGLAEVLTDAAR